ncbi:MAG: terminase large subunit [Nitrospinae bacterium]|nr:terminase large subunit [Nitrospinota bacterium]
MELFPFQRRFIKAATSPTTMTAALSLPRGNGKSWLAARICADALQSIAPHEEIVLMAASIEQARIVFRFVRSMLGEAGYRYIDSATRAGITKQKGGRLRVVGSNGKTAMGLVNTPLVVADEPGSWEINGGQLLHDAIETAMGKPGSPLRAIYIGTLAPMATDESHWWHGLATGVNHAPHVHAVCLQGDPERWDQWPEILRVNPLAKHFPELREKLKIERAEARHDPRLKARFLSYRLNLPSEDQNRILLRPDEWRAALKRTPAPTEGEAPIVGLDLGANRAWSAAVALWPSGRCEAIAYAPGLPDIADQERRDRVQRGRYQALVDAGRLRVADGLAYPPPALLWGFVLESWGWPAHIVADRFAAPRLLDATEHRAAIEFRRTLWSESAEDIRALRRLVADGPLSVAPESAALLTASLQVAKVENDKSGNVRMIKNVNNCGRDDVAAALILGAGAWQRLASRPRGPVYLGMT